MFLGQPYDVLESPSFIITPIVTSDVRDNDLLGVVSRERIFWASSRERGYFGRRLGREEHLGVLHDARLIEHMCGRLLIITHGRALVDRPRHTGPQSIFWGSWYGPRQHVLEPFGQWVEFLLAFRFRGSCVAGSGHRRPMFSKPGGERMGHRQCPLWGS